MGHRFIFSFTWGTDLDIVLHGAQIKNYIYMGWPSARGGHGLEGTLVCEHRPHRAHPLIVAAFVCKG